MRTLLASDGSRDSRRATRWLRDVSLPSGTAITVLTVATLTEPPRDAQSMRDLRASLRNDARRAADRAVKTLKQRWPQVDAMVTEGDPRVEIVHVAEAMRAEMIVVGARGLGRVKRFFLGSTSLAVARYAPCAVAVIRGRPHRTGRVLVAIDGSNGSRAALRFLFVSELERDSRLTLVHVVPRAPVAEGQAAEAKTILADAAAMLDHSRRRIERLVAHGDPAREIVKIARSRDVDLVVVGARGLRTLGRLLLGSVSETVLHQVGQPVMIVRE